MEKKFKAEAIPFQEINRSGLDNLNLFYDFLYVNGKPSFVRQNNLLAIFFPFMATKIWYKSFELEAESFEAAKTKRRSQIGLGIGVGLGLLLSATVNSARHSVATFLDSWKVNLSSISSNNLRFLATFFILTIIFLLGFLVINIAWRGFGYFLFHIQGLKINQSNIDLKVRKISYFDFKHRRRFSILASWIGAPIMLLFASLMTMNQEIYPLAQFFNNYILDIVIAFSFMPMLLPPDKYDTNI